MEATPRQPPLDQQELLLYKHKRLAARVDEQRAQISALEARLEQHEQQRTDYTNTLSCINRLWTALNDDVASLIQRALPDDASDATAPTTNGVQAADTADPFLHALLHNASDAHTDPQLAKLANDAHAHERDAASVYSDVESALRARTAATNAALARLLQALQAKDGGDSDDTARAKALQRRVDAQQGVVKALVNRVRLLQDEVDKDRLTMRDLQSELADKTEALIAVKRKLGQTPKHAPVPANDTPPAETVQPDNNTAAKGSSQVPVTAHSDDVVPAAQHQEVVLQHAAAAAEVEALRAMLEDKSAKAEAAVKDVGRLEREVEALKNDIKHETHVASSKQYAALQARQERLAAELVPLRQAAEAARRDAEQERLGREAAEAKVLAFAGVRAGHEGLQRYTVELQERIGTLEATIRALELTAHAHDTKGGRASTVEELVTLCNGLQKENCLMKQSMQRHEHVATKLAEAAKATAEVDARVQAVMEAKAAVEVQLQEARQQLQEAQQDHASAQELELFVRAMLEFSEVPAAAQEAANVAALQGRVSALAQQVASARAEAEAASAKLKEALPPEEAESLRAQRAEHEAACRALRGEVKELTAHMKKLEADAEAYMAEIEAIGSAFEGMQTQNTRLLDGVTRRDEEFNKLTAKNISLENRVKELEAARVQHEQLSTHLRSQVSAHDTAMATLQEQGQRAMAEVAAAREAARAAGAQAADATTVARQREDEATTLQEQLQAAHVRCEAAKRSLDEEAIKGAKERAKRQKLEDEARVLKAQVARLKTVTGADDAAAELQEELTVYRALLRCSVCSERRKDTIITKCYHMFCSQCIARNLETRHRKCPGCNVGFGAGDVKSVYLG